jgi:hypothetical protein
MAKKKESKPKKAPKKRASKYEEKLVVKGAFIDVVNAAVKPKE